MSGFEKLFEEEKLTMGQDCELVQHLHLEGGGRVIVYTCASERHVGLGRMRQRRVAIGTEDGTPKTSIIFESDFIDR